MANVLVIGKYYFPFQGGIEDNTRYVAERLSDRHNVTVLAFAHDKKAGNGTIAGVSVKRYQPVAVLKSQPISFGIAAAILSERADVIHFHAPNVWSSLFLFTRLAFSKKKPTCVVTHHMDIYKRPILRFIARRLYNGIVSRSHSVIVTSRKTP